MVRKMGSAKCSLFYVSVPSFLTEQSAAKERKAHKGKVRSAFALFAFFCGYYLPMGWP
jgi:hypothetical protein